MAIGGPLPLSLEGPSSYRPMPVATFLHVVKSAVVLCVAPFLSLSAFSADGMSKYGYDPKDWGLGLPPLN